MDAGQDATTVRSARRGARTCAALLLAVAAAGPARALSATAVPAAHDDTSARGVAPVAPADDAATRDAAIVEQGTALLQSLVDRGVPGASAAVVLADGTVLAFTAGVADADTGEPLGPDDRMLSGSVGKTFVTAAVHRLVAAGALDLDARAASFFEHDDPSPAWLDRLPNGRAVTVRQLLRHTTGIPRYVFDPAFTARLTAEPDRVWRPEELLAHVFDAEPLFAPGEGWAYADTNYLVVGLVLERVTGRRFYDDVREHFTGPLGLADSVPSDSRRIPGLVQGHVVMGRQMGIPERTLEDGVSVYNLQFEWCGGGWAQTPRDLARWAARLYGGEAVEGDDLATMLDAVDAPGLGPGVRYGLGVMLRDTEAGPLRSHDGFMPGYLTSMGLFPESGVAAAVQLNGDDARAVGRPLTAVLVDLARIATRAEAGASGG